MKYKYEFEMPDTPYESNCRVCPLLSMEDGEVWCTVQGIDSAFELFPKSEKLHFELYMEMEMGCPLEVVK